MAALAIVARHLQLQMKNPCGGTSVPLTTMQEDTGEMYQKLFLIMQHVQDGHLQMKDIFTLGDAGIDRLNGPQPSGLELCATRIGNCAVTRELKTN